MTEDRRRAEVTTSCRGGQRTILHSTVAGAWTAQSGTTAPSLNGVWGSASGDLYVVGIVGVGATLHRP